MTFEDETQRLKVLFADCDARLEVWSPHSAGPMNGAWSALVEQRAYLRASVANREAQRA